MALFTQTRDRRKADPSTPKTGAPAIITTITLSETTTIQIVFDTRIFVSGIPPFTAGAETVASVQTVNATTVLLTFTGDVAGGTLVVPQSAPGIRTPGGGFVPAGNYAIPAV